MLEVIEDDRVLTGEPGKRIRMGTVRCDCGSVKRINLYAINHRQMTSCGCFNFAKRGKDAPNYRHGHRPKYGDRSPTMGTWLDMIYRCENPGSSNWVNYGGRGISICERWRSSFENFLADMGERPPGRTIDRIDVNGNYEPGNCRWATPYEQGQNVRHAKQVTHNGLTLTLSAWARHLGVDRQTVRYRMRVYGVPVNPKKAEAIAA